MEQESGDARLRRDREADLFRGLYPALRRYAAVVGSTLDDPDDLLHDALVRVLRRRSLSELANPSAYLRRTIANLVVDRSRHQGVEERARHLVVQDGDATDHYPSDLQILERLSPTDRSIVYMVDVEGRSFAEAAEVSGCSVGAARLRASRARRSLRGVLKESQS